MTRSQSQLARSQAVKIGQLATGYFLALKLGKRKEAKKLKAMIEERIKQ